VALSRILRQGIALAKGEGYDKVQDAAFIMGDDTFVHTDSPM